MKKIALIMALALGVSAYTLMSQEQGGPAGSGGGPPGNEGGPGGPGGRSGSGRAGGFHLLPPFARAQLNLTSEQEQQIAALEQETKAKLAKILTGEQLQKLQQMRPPRMGGGPNGGGQGNGGQRRGPNGGGPGGPGDGPESGGPGPGGPGGPGGPPPGQGQ